MASSEEVLKPRSDDSAAPSDGGEPSNFIYDIIDEHNRTGRFGGRVHTRFPPNRTATCTSAMPKRS